MRGGFREGAGRPKRNNVKRFMIQLNQLEVDTLAKVNKKPIKAIRRLIMDRTLSWEEVKKMFLESLELRLETIEHQMAMDLHPFTREAFKQEIRALNEIFEKLGGNDE